ncbi:helix-turn-helix transcriptional regulator [Halovulum dunhuangense]|uniref:Helix-turn-helix transcriptional regulator n=1 Tax=Halovulum dunhuangense TaxID=1505036 RepID=A0A849L6X4_9RHOB|nr:helix-turn-helix transcriptional regulator [Halovulum dunhuangense]
MQVFGKRQEFFLDDASIGRTIRLHRRRKNLCIDEVAKKAEIPARLLAAYEQGSARVRVDRIDAIADALGVTPRSLLIRSV